MRTGSSRVGFTLVELLVVIGIIALLISILLPALSKAKKQALIVSELSNMRQVGLAVAMYANEHKGRLPAGSGNNGVYPHTHDVVRSRLYGYVWDYTANVFVKTGASYLKPVLEMGNLGFIEPGPTSRVWGCPMTSGSQDWHRYGTSWWWNAGPHNTCDEKGQPITCIGNFTGEWHKQPAGFSIADGYRMNISGGGYEDRFNRQPNPDNIVLITDAGAPIRSDFPGPGHLRAAPKSLGDVEGNCTLFLSGRALWRGRAELQRVNFGNPIDGFR